MLRNVRVHLSCLCVLLVGCSVLAVPARAQSDVGTIAGFIRDHSGAVVPGARVTLQNEGTGQEQSAISDAQGRFTITNLQPADYTMTAEAKGFKKFISTHNRLSASTTINIDATLDIGQLSETVEVTATASVARSRVQSAGELIAGCSFANHRPMFKRK